MRIKIADGKVQIDQIPYLEKILHCFGMQNAKAAKTPMIKGYKPLTNTETVNPDL